MVVDGSISNLGASDPWGSVLGRGVGLSCTNATAESSDSIDGVSLVSRSNCTARAGNRSLTILSRSILSGSRGCDEVKMIL